MSLLDIMLADSPGALWTLDDAALISGKLLDSSGNGRDLSVAGVPILRGRTPPGAYATNAAALGLGSGVGTSNDLLSWTPVAAVPPPFTIETWYYQASAGAANAGGYLWGSRGGADYGCSGAMSPAGSGLAEGSRGEVGNTSTLAWYTTAFGGPSGAGKCALNTWHHAVWVLDTTSWQMYLDKALIGSALSIDYSNAHLMDAARALALGNYRPTSPNDGYRFNGYLWYAAWYPSALSAARVAARYNEVVVPPSVSGGNASSRAVGPLARFLMGPEPVPAAAAAAAAPSVGQIWPRGAKNTAG